MQANGTAVSGGWKSGWKNGQAKHRLSTTGKVKDLASLDRRTVAYRKTLQLIDAIEADLGGADQLSTAERQIVRHAALTSAMLEDYGTRWLGGEPVDPAVYCTLANSERRLYETCGLKRRSRDVTPSLEAYVARRMSASPLEPRLCVKTEGALPRARVPPDETRTSEPPSGEGAA